MECNLGEVYLTCGGELILIAGYPDKTTDSGWKKGLMFLGTHDKTVAGGRVYSVNNVEEYIIKYDGRLLFNLLETVKGKF